MGFLGGYLACSPAGCGAWWASCAARAPWSLRHSARTSDHPDQGNTPARHVQQRPEVTPSYRAATTSQSTSKARI